MSFPFFVGSSGLPPVSLEVLAKIRGAMWTARAPVSYGPRPGQPDNCICIDYYECFPPEERPIIKAAYIDERRLTHAPMGPLVDPGYHGLLPSTDWRSNPEPYFAGALDLEQHGCRVIHFLRPDRGVQGLDWTVDDLERELGPIFRSAQAQDLMRIVCLGWEPGPRYYYDNAWWVDMLAWQADVFPKALRCLHMVSDCDAPTGGDDYRTLTNGICWQRVAPYVHVFLAQFGGYVDGQSVAEFVPKFQGALVDLQRRFSDPTYANGADWPKFSAWGPNAGIIPVGGEYAAYKDFWQNAPERESIQIGAAARAVNSWFFDGGPPA